MTNLSEGNNIPLRLQNRAKTNGKDAALHWRDGDNWNSRTWAEHYENVRKFGGALLNLGFEVGDSVSISGNNSKEWITACLGSMYIEHSLLNLSNFDTRSIPICCKPYGSKSIGT